MKLRQSLGLASCLLVLSQSASALPQFINEFHYDNSGADQHEYVEIAGVSGTDLSGWRLDFYNGSNGNIYASWNLSGLIDDEGSGFGAVFFQGSNGLQNGPSDGIALVNDLGALIQFISYEGQITGQSGVASGIQSQDIGLAEGGSTPLGSSLQLVGTGQGYDDFSWISAQASFGDLNGGQGLVSIASQVIQPVSPQSVSEPATLAGFGILTLFFALRRSGKNSLNPC